MPRLPNCFFPDVNVWLALTYGRHIHHAAAAEWFAPLGLDCRVYFCRFTQIGLLRLLSTEAVMGTDGVMNQKDAWRTYDHCLEDCRIQFLEEPTGLDTEFRSLTQHWLPSPKGWMDAYLAAFASTGDLPLVTFDRAFRGRVRELLILEA